jgi:hypothetical protein
MPWMEVIVGVSGGELASIIHDLWSNMCLLAPESNTRRGVRGMTDMVLMDILSSYARLGQVLEQLGPRPED